MVAWLRQNEIDPTVAFPARLERTASVIDIDDSGRVEGLAVAKHANRLPNILSRGGPPSPPSAPLAIEGLRQAHLGTDTLAAAQRPD